jgi:hypothetical protein
MSSELSPILDRRLVIVTGKGGTGKTTVASGLAVAAARTGLSVLIAEVGGLEQVPQFIAPGHPPVGYAGSELFPGLYCIHIDPHEALAEYLGLQLHARTLVDLVMRNKGFAQLLDAAPGWRELITLGKVWHLAEMQEHGRPRYDLIVVDAPATGHGLTFLDVPRVVASAVRTGPLRGHAHLVEDLVRDPERTLLLPVALAEELPAHETAELVGRARSQLGIAIDRIVVNAVAPEPFPEGVPSDLDERLLALDDGIALGTLPRPGVLAACARYLRARHELNHTYVEQIRRDCGEPLIVLPYRPGGLTGAEALGDFAAPLLGTGTPGANP